MPSTVVPSHTYNPGTLTTPSHTVGPAMNFLTIVTAALDWTAGKTVTLLVEQSSDAGSTWRADLRAVSAGPIAVADQYWEVSLEPVPIGQTRLARATITLAGGSLTTPVTLTTSPAAL